MESIKTLILLKNTFQKCCNDFLKLLSRSVIIFGSKNWGHMNLSRETQNETP